MSLNNVIRWNDLDWIVGPDRDMTWLQAKEWVNSLDGEWRMPEEYELKSLYDSGIVWNEWGPFENSGYAVWSGEENDSWFPFNFFFGSSDSDDCVGYLASSDKEPDFGRAFAVKRN